MKINNLIGNFLTILSAVNEVSENKSVMPSKEMIVGAGLVPAHTLPN